MSSDSFYVRELKEQIWSFTEAMAEAIDARTPYNATHIRKVAEYAGMVADHINELNKKGLEDEFFDDNRREQLIMSALLHDVGKIVTPSRVMNKASRLGNLRKDIFERFLLIGAYLKIDLLEGRIDEKTYSERIEEISELKENILKADRAKGYEEELLAKISPFFDKEYTGQGMQIPFFTREEKECLTIKKGTLSNREREIMETHVVLTNHILSKVKFHEEYKNVPIFASQHHEMLDGSGYPKHLKGDELPIESRILSACDICDALLAADRPYKSAMAKEAAFKTMEEMAKEGKLDGKIVGYLISCLSEVD